MKLLIEDVWSFNQTGVGKYSEYLYQELKKNEDKIIISTFAWGGWKKRIYLYMLKKFLVPPIDLFWSEKADWVLFTDYICYPKRSSIKSAVIIYDLSFLKHPQFVEPKNAQFLSGFVPQSIRNADLIITISEAVKKELQDWFQMPKDKIIVIYPKIDPKLFPSAQKENKNKYFLFVGTLEPRKNIIGILDAYLGLPKEIKKDYALVLAGGKGWLDEEIQRKLKEEKEENIKVLNQVTQSKLLDLYQNCSLFLFPSFYEGFGMPPVEAAYSGASVLVSDIPIFREIFEGGVYWVNPYQVESIRKGILAFLSAGSQLQPKVNPNIKDLGVENLIIKLQNSCQ